MAVVGTAAAIARTAGNGGTVMSSSIGAVVGHNYIVTAWTAMAWIVMAYGAMADRAMAYVVMVYIVMAYMVMAYTPT